MLGVHRGHADPTRAALGPGERDGGRDALNIPSEIMVGTSSANVGGLRGVTGRDGGEQRGRRGGERGNEHVRGCDLTRYAAIRGVHRALSRTVRAENCVWKLAEESVFAARLWIFFYIFLGL